MTRVINFYAGPGAGKSTLAAGLFYEMKLKGLSVELVTEFAKDLTWEGHLDDLSNPLYVSGTQLRRMRRLVDKVDYIITDSPLLVACLYVKENIRAPFEELMLSYHEEFDNVNFIVDREKKYDRRGRNQTEEQAKTLDWEVQSLPVPREEGITRVPGNGPGVHMVMDELGLG